MQQYQQAFPCFIDSDGRIFAQQGYQGNQHIGWSLQKYSELEKLASDAMAKAEDYKKQLIDAGLLKPVLTSEEQIAELTKQVLALTNQNTLLAQQVAGLTDLLTTPNTTIATSKE